MRFLRNLSVAKKLALSAALAMTLLATLVALVMQQGGVAAHAQHEERAAVAARDDASLVIFARTGAVSITGLEDALARVRAYNHTGTDGIFLTGVTKRAELDALAAEAKLPLVLGTLSDEISDRAYLASRGVRIALQGHLPFQAAIQAIHATLKALREGTPPAEVGGMAPKALREAAMREADYAEKARRFLG